MHDRVVLRAAQRLHALAVARARLVDVLGDRRRADERDRSHQRMREQRVDRLLVAVHDVEHAVGQARLPAAARPCAATASDRARTASARTCCRTRSRPGTSTSAPSPGKLNGVMPAHTPTGWRIDQLSTSVPTFSLSSPFSRCGMPVANSTTSMPRVTDAFGVGERLAVLLRDDLRAGPCGARPAARGNASARAHGAAPASRAMHGKRVAAAGDRGVDVGGVGERHVADDLAGGRVGHFAVARRRAARTALPPIHSGRRSSVVRSIVTPPLRAASIASPAAPNWLQWAAVSQRIAGSCDPSFGSRSTCDYIRTHPPGLRTLQRAHVHRQCAPGLAPRAARSSDTLTREFSCSGSSRSSITAAVPLAVARAHAAPKSSVRCTLSAWAP